jgi:hypothetical protein
MRKKLVSQSHGTAAVEEQSWADLDRRASVEVTSEAEGYPVEEALLGGDRGWRAAGSGPQTIRLLFDEPQTVHLIRLVFKEEVIARTQEFVLRWQSCGAGSWKDIVRQQWTFAPPNTTVECEEYKVELSSVSGLELSIKPDISMGDAHASLQSLQVAAIG